MTLTLEPTPVETAPVKGPTAYAAPGQPASLVSLKPRYDNFIGGRWVAPVSGQYMTNVSPVTGKPFCEVAKSTAADVELALDAAHAAKVAWGAVSYTHLTLPTIYSV